jgi:probable HAF family extracellular repeat protein
MKNNTAMYVASLTLIVALAVPVDVVAQAHQGYPNKPHHYQIVDLGSTFGGPQSYIIPGSGNAFSGTSILNKVGTVAGFADTSASDPFPDFCFWDCNVAHAFLAQSGGVLTDLGALPGGGSSAPVWVSRNGLVAGLSENGQTDPLYPGLPQLRAVLWQQGTITDLGTLPEGGYQSEASAVNSSGQVVGSALNTTPDINSMQTGVFLLWGGDGGITPPYQYQTRAFLWDKGNGMQDLGTLPGGTDAQAFLINERGQVAGMSYTSSTKSGSCLPLATSSFIWEREKGMTDLGGLGGTCTAVSALNNKGQVVGESFRAGDKAAPAFLWEDGSLHELPGSFGGDFTGAFAINDQGEVAGFGYLSGNSLFHAALWKNSKRITDLGVIGADSCSYAAAINASGQIVGSSSPVCDFGAAARAFLWEDGSLFDLNSLVPPAAALYLELIYAINDRGEIAGQGVDTSGNEHAFLLVPCDGNHPGVEGCDYSLMDASAAARVSPVPVVPRATNTSGSNPAGKMLRQRLGFARFAEGSEKTLNGKATTGREVELVPNHLNFGCFRIFPDICACSPPRTTTLTNIGTTRLAISRIAISGPFSQTNTCGKSVAPGGSCNINVRWSRSLGSGDVSVNDNGGDSPQIVSLSARDEECRP